MVLGKTGLHLHFVTEDHTNKNTGKTLMKKPGVGKTMRFPHPLGDGRGSDTDPGGGKVHDQAPTMRKLSTVLPFVVLFR